MSEIYRSIPANTEVFSIALQEKIKFSNDIVVSISNTYKDCFSDEYVFAKLQLKLFDDTSLLDKTNGDLTINLKNTQNFNKKDIQVFTWTYKKD